MLVGISAAESIGQVMISSNVVDGRNTKRTQTQATVSGCCDGWETLKASSSLRAVSTRMMLGNWDMSTSKLGQVVSNLELEHDND